MKHSFLRLSSIAAIFVTACATSCAVDDVVDLDTFDGGVDATVPYDAASETSSPFDAQVVDAQAVDAADSAAPVDAGTDSGVHVVIDSGSDSGGLDAGSDSGGDSGTEDDAGDGGADSGLNIVNGCTTFEDDTAAAAIRVIQGPPGSAPVQFTPSCMSIRAGQSVTFQQADFSNHPLIAANGTTPSPITFTSSGTTVTFAFPNVGTYGFECELHPTMMFGAIQVTP